MSYNAEINNWVKYNCRNQYL